MFFPSDAVHCGDLPSHIKGISVCTKDIYLDHPLDAIFPHLLGIDTQVESYSSGFDCSTQHSATLGSVTREM